MRLTFLLAKRYLFTKRHPRAIHGMSILSFIALTIGITAIFLIMNVFNGFEVLIRGLYSSFYPDVIVTPAEGEYFKQNEEWIDTVKNLPGVISVIPAIEEQALLTHSDKRLVAYILAVDSQFLKSSKLDSFIVMGTIPSPFRGPVALLGYGVSYLLDLNPEAPLSLLQAHILRKQVSISMFTSPNALFRTVKLKPTGSFAIQQEIDQKYVIVPLEFWQRKTAQRGKVTSFFVDTEDDFREEVAEHIKQICTDCEVKTLWELNPTLYRILKAEKWSVFAMLAFVVLLAGFTKISALIMLVIYKRPDIRIMLALGAPYKTIEMAFFLYGLLMTVASLAVGILLSLVVTWLQQEYGLIKIQGATFIIENYPVAIKIEDYLIISLFVLALGIFSSYPAARLVRVVKPYFRNP